MPSRSPEAASSTRALRSADRRRGARIFPEGLLRFPQAVFGLHRRAQTPQPKARHQCHADEVDQKHIQPSFIGHGLARCREGFGDLSDTLRVWFFRLCAMRVRVVLEGRLRFPQAVLGLHRGAQTPQPKARHQCHADEVDQKHIQPSFIGHGLARCREGFGDLSDTLRVWFFRLCAMRVRVVLEGRLRFPQAVFGLHRGAQTPQPKARHQCHADEVDQKHIQPGFIEHGLARCREGFGDLSDTLRVWFFRLCAMRVRVVLEGRLRFPQAVLGLHRGAQTPQPKARHQCHADEVDQKHIQPSFIGHGLARCREGFGDLSDTLRVWFFRLCAMRVRVVLEGRLRFPQAVLGLHRGAQTPQPKARHQCHADEVDQKHIQPSFIEHGLARCREGFGDLSDTLRVWFFRLCAMRVRVVLEGRLRFPQAVFGLHRGAQTPQPKVRHQCHADEVDQKHIQPGFIEHGLARCREGFGDLSDTLRVWFFRLCAMRVRVVSWAGVYRHAWKSEARFRLLDNLLQRKNQVFANPRPLCTAYIRRKGSNTQIYGALGKADQTHRDFVFFFVEKISACFDVHLKGILDLPELFGG